MSNPYQPFSDLYVVPGLAGMRARIPKAPAWHTPFLDPCISPPGYDGLRGDDAPVPTTTSTAVSAPGAVTPPAASPWPVIVGGFAVGYLLGRFIKW